MRLALVLLLVCLPVHALEFKKIGNNKYEMIGFFDEYSYIDIRDFLNKRKDQQITIIPFSHGGYANDVFDIMREIRKHGNITFFVDPKAESYCHSMCAFSSVAANKRYGKFGFHPLSHTSTIDIQVVKDINKNLQEYLIYYGMNKNLAQTTTLSQSQELQYVIFNGSWK
jgi:hypothetical protein